MAVFLPGLPENTHLFPFPVRVFVLCTFCDCQCVFVFLLLWRCLFGLLFLVVSLSLHRHNILLSFFRFCLFMEFPYLVFLLRSWNPLTFHF